MKRCAHHRGFQLIEVIVATLIFFTISLLLLNLLPTSQWAAAKADHRLAAENMAYSQLEELKGLPFESLQTGTQTFSKSDNGLDFQLEVQVSTLDNADPDLVRHAEVTVTWEVRGKSHQVEAATYISRIRH